MTSIKQQIAEALPASYVVMGEAHNDSDSVYSIGSSKHRRGDQQLIGFVVVTADEGDVPSKVASAVARIERMYAEQKQPLNAV